MAERKRITVKGAPSLSELRSLFTSTAPNPIESALTGFNKERDLASVLAQRKLDAERKRQQIEEQNRAVQQDQQLRTFAGRAPSMGTQEFLGELGQNLPEKAIQHRLEGLATDKEKLKKDYVKVGETEDEIIMANKNDPTQTVRIAASGIGKKKGSGKPPALATSVEMKALTTGGFIDGLKSIADKMPQPSGENRVVRGITGLAKGLGLKAQKAAGGQFGGDADVIAYMNSIDTMGRAIYKFLSGDVGNISVSEGQFAVNLLPRVTDAPEVRQAKIDNLQNLKNKTMRAVEIIKKEYQKAGLPLDKNYEQDVQDKVLTIMQGATASPMSEKGALLSDLVEE